jgi:hypothetical protein
MLNVIYAECCYYAECHYAEGRSAFFIAAIFAGDNYAIFANVKREKHQPGNPDYWGRVSTVILLV